MASATFRKVVVVALAVTAAVVVVALAAVWPPFWSPEPWRRRTRRLRHLVRRRRYRGIDLKPPALTTASFFQDT